MKLQTIMDLLAEAIDTNLEDKAAAKLKSTIDDCLMGAGFELSQRMEGCRPQDHKAMQTKLERLQDMAYAFDMASRAK